MSQPKQKAVYKTHAVCIQQRNGALLEILYTLTYRYTPSSQFFPITPSPIIPVNEYLRILDFNRIKDKERKAETAGNCGKC